MDLSIIIPSLRPKFYANFIRSVKANTDGVEYEILSNHERGNLFEIINREFDRAKGKYVVLTCDDCVVHPEWARRMIDFMETSPAMTLGNFCVLSRKTIGVHKSTGIQYYGKQCSIFPFARKKEVMSTWGYCMDPALNRFYGDIDLSLRYWKAGGQVRDCDGAAITIFSNRDEIKKTALQDHFNADEATFHKKWRGHDFSLHGDKTSA